MKCYSIQVILSLCFLSKGVSATESFIVGSYTENNNEGVNVITLNTQNLSFTPPKTVAITHNPSYLALSDNHQTLYAVDESSYGRINQFSWLANAKKFNKVHSYKNIGADPCYIAIKSNGLQLSVTSYSSGNSKFFDIDTSTNKLNQVAEFQSQGRSVHNRQEAPHMHWMNWDNNDKFAYSIDLGTDQVFVHQYKEKKLSTDVAIKLPAGEGPRHMVFHPHLNNAYIVSELNNTVLVVQQNLTNGKLNNQQRISILPKDSQGDNFAAAIKISTKGEHLYVSIRGTNLLSVFDVLTDGSLRIKQHIETGGNWPRDFTLSQQEDFLLVTNQHSNNIVLFKRDNVTGILSKTDSKVVTSQPTFITPFNPSK